MYENPIRTLRRKQLDEVTRGASYDEMEKIFLSLPENLRKIFLNTNNTKGLEAIPVSTFRARLKECLQHCCTNIIA